MKILVSLVFSACVFWSFGQDLKALKNFKPAKDYDNVHVKKIAEDDHQSSFIIWVKDKVPEHYHADHTELIVVLEGKAKMTVNGEEKEIKKGDFMYIPEGTKHAVLEVLTHKPLKVLSVQTPLFDGKDRIFTKKKD